MKRLGCSESEDTVAIVRLVRARDTASAKSRRSCAIRSAAAARRATRASAAPLPVTMDSHSERRSADDPPRGGGHAPSCAPTMTTCSQRRPTARCAVSNDTAGVVGAAAVTRSAATRWPWRAASSPRIPTTPAYRSLSRSAVAKRARTASMSWPLGACPASAERRSRSGQANPSLSGIADDHTCHSTSPGAAPELALARTAASARPSAMTRVHASCADPATSCTACGSAMTSTSRSRTSSVPGGAGSPG